MAATSRRQLLWGAASAAGAVLAGSLVARGLRRTPSVPLPVTPRRAGSAAPLHPRPGEIGSVGPLLEPDENGLQLPRGFRSRVLARSGRAVGESDFFWHDAPDGGAVFSSDDGGWIYVSNAELEPDGGVSALRFDRDARPHFIRLARQS